MTSHLSEGACDVAVAEDPVATTLNALARGGRLLLRTSGSSGRPRAVIRSAASWTASFPYVSDLLGLDGTARVWVPGPLSSTMNLFGAVHAVDAGASLVHSAAGASHAHLTPAALTRALPELGGVHVLVAGDRLSRRLYDRVVAAGVEVSHYYGAAELSFVAWGTHEANLQPFPEVEVRVREGVLWVRSPYLCEGYDGAGPLYLDPEGFATVGDRGHLANGCLRVTGRGSDAVTTAGATVLVADVETALRPVVTGELVVVGVPHADLGEVVAAVLTDGACFAAARRRSRATLSPAQQPRLWFAVEQLPLTSAGKVDRAALTAQLVSPAEGARRLT